MTDFITDQRTEIFDNNNTAQQQLADLLATIDNKKQEYLILETSLHGDIDLDILHKDGFHNIKSIVFIEGQITSIKNIPKNVKSLKVANNLLIEMPTSIEHLDTLDLNNNYLTTVDLQTAKHLKVFMINSNTLITIENIPSNIRELYCENNEIRKLDLQMADKIQVLHCSNNKNLLVEHFPDYLKDFRMENTQFQEIYKNLGNVKFDTKHAKDHNQKIEYVDALNQYFKLKHKYEDKAFELKKNEYDKLVLKKISKSKIRKILSAIRIPCINCNQPNGTIFDLKSTNETRIYSAICGNRKQPCNLNIQLSTGQFLDIWTSIETAKYFLTEHKEKIIKHKLDVLFNYMDEKNASSEFKHDLDEYYAIKELYEHALKKYISTYHNPETHEKIKEKSATLFDKLEEMEKIIGEYRLNNYEMVLKDGMNVYFREIMDLSNQLYSLKNGMSEMYMDENTGMFTLKQWPTTLSNMDYSHDNIPEVVKFNKLGK